MFKVIVSRKRWFRGCKDSSYLLQPKGTKMCCIGFLARQRLLYTPKQIRGTGTLDSICDLDYYPLSDEQKAFADENEDALTAAYNVNDDPKLNDTQREQQLKVIGKEMGIQFQFVD